MEYKTNVMRILDKNKISYIAYDYGIYTAINGAEVAKVLNKPCSQVFKTLVTVSKSGQNYIFVIPVDKELNLKKAAKTVGEKSIEMLKSKDLLSTTGYIHGGCSPLGMKKRFITHIDISAEEFETIVFSAGKIGYQVEMSLSELSKIIEYRTADLCVES